MNDLPIYYMYEDDNGWHKTDQSLTQALNKVIKGAGQMPTSAYAFLPQYKRPSDLKARRKALIIMSDGTIAVRTKYITRTHSDKHYRCEMVDDEHCRCRVAQMLEYDSNRNMWIISQD